MVRTSVASSWRNSPSSIWGRTLLEALSEHSVTVEKTRHRLAEPFFVVATQNPVESTGTYSFPMYWDETFDSWIALGITGQPAAVLLSPDGEVLGAWRGMFPIDETLQLAADARS